MTRDKSDGKIDMKKQGNNSSFGIVEHMLDDETQMIDFGNEELNEAFKEIKQARDLLGKKTLLGDSFA